MALQETSHGSSQKERVAKMGQIASSIGQAGSSLGSAMSNANTFAPDPSGFNGSEWAARFMGGAAKGLGQGLQNQQQMKPQGGQAPMPVPMTQQPRSEE